MAVLALVVAAPQAFASTEYFFSGSACQADDSADDAKIVNIGAGVANVDTTSYSTAYVVCPVTSLISTSLDQLALQVHVHNYVGGYWEVDDMTFGVIWYSSSKSATTAGDTDLTWTGTDLYGTVSNYAGYNFIATVPGKCTSGCASQYNYLQAYWVTHTQA
jgi:hypothetical protein